MNDYKTHFPQQQNICKERLLGWYELGGGGGVNIMRQSSCEDELKRKRPEWHTLRRLAEGSLPCVWVWEGAGEKWARVRGEGAEGLVVTPSQ